MDEARSCLNDPWGCLSHLKAIFAAVVRYAEECPEAVDMAWIRRALPDEGDTNRSRRLTDPIWRVVPSATRADAPAEVRRLIRRRQRGTDVAVLDREMYGYLVSRVALLHPNGGEWTLLRTLGEAAATLEAKKAQAGRDFGESVRERRRHRSLPLPVAENILPFRQVSCRIDTDEPATHHSPRTAASPRGPVRSRPQWGEDRMEEAWLRLQEAEQHGAPQRLQAVLEAGYERELSLYAATFAESAANSGNGSQALQ